MPRGKGVLRQKVLMPRVTEAKSVHARKRGGPQPESAHARGLLSQKVPMRGGGGGVLSQKKCSCPWLLRQKVPGEGGSSARKCSWPGLLRQKVSMPGRGGGPQPESAHAWGLLSQKVPMRGGGGVLSQKVLMPLVTEVTCIMHA